MKTACHIAAKGGASEYMKHAVSNGLKSGGVVCFSILLMISTGCGGGSSTSSVASVEAPKSKVNGNINDPGCQSARRTVRYSDGVVLGNGDYIPCVVDTGMASGEPSLNITRDGTLLRAPAKEPVGIAVSSDNGATWARHVLPDGAPSGVEDSYLDPVSERLFYNAALSADILYSDDLGITWHTGIVEYKPEEPFSSEGDWPKFWSGPAVTPRTEGFVNNVYYCNWVTPAGVASSFGCFKSINGGETFKPVGSVQQANVCPDVVSTPGLGHGRGIITADGTIYMPVQGCVGESVYVSYDEAETWTIYPIPDSGTGVTLLTGVEALQSGGKLTQEQFASYVENPRSAFDVFKLFGPEVTASSTVDGIGLDENGGMYAAWTGVEDGERLVILFSYSDNGGQSWTSPIRLMPPEVVQGTLPSISVTPSGRIGIGYYGTTGDGTWTGYLTVSDNGSSEKPIFETAAVTPADAPLMDAPCCFSNGLNEYTSARWAPDGSLWAAFVAYKDDYLEGMMGRLVPAK